MTIWCWFLFVLYLSSLLTENVELSAATDWVINCISARQTIEMHSWEPAVSYKIVYFHSVGKRFYKKQYLWFGHLTQALTISANDVGYRKYAERLANLQ